MNLNYVSGDWWPEQFDMIWNTLQSFMGLKHYLDELTRVRLNSIVISLANNSETLKFNNLQETILKCTFKIKREDYKHKTT